MKKLVMLITFIMLISIPTLVADTEDSAVFEKLVNLKEKIKSYFEDMPQIGWRQKVKIQSVVRQYRPEIRKNVDTLRPIVIKVRKEIRDVLSHEQLLKLLDIQDQMILRPEAEKAALMLAKIEKQDRVKLISLIREIWRGDINNLEKNIEALHTFKMETIFPQVQKYLELTADQEQKIKGIIEKNKEEIHPILVKIVTQGRQLCDAIKEKMSLEQVNYFESKREKIYQDIVEFVSGL